LLADTVQLDLIHLVDFPTSKHLFKFTCTETGLCRKIASTELLSSSPFRLHLPRRLSDLNHSVLQVSSEVVRRVRICILSHVFWF
jgi:hypothetical protein